MKPVPYYKQKTPYTCALACLRMVFETIGKKLSENDLSQIIKIKTGSGFSPRMVEFICEVINAKYDYHFESSLAELEELIKIGFHPVVLVNPSILYSLPEEEHGHYIVIKDKTKEKIIYNDPDQEYGGENKEIAIEIFLLAWENKHNFIFIIKGEKK